MISNDADTNHAARLFYENVLRMHPGPEMRDVAMERLHALDTAEAEELTATPLDELIERMEDAARRLDELKDNVRETTYWRDISSEETRLAAKAEGVRLCLSYAYEMKREAKRDE